MPSVSFDSKSFLLQTGRASVARLSIVGAAFDATLVEPTQWAAELGALRHAGFNTVVVRVPWRLHEPTPDRFVFDGACDIRRVVELAGQLGLKVVLRIGPCVGGGFAAGGLPGWIGEYAGDRVREAHPAFLARVTRFWRALAAQFVDLQASRNGGGRPRPVIAVGLEDDWRCLDGEVGDAYFSALIRFVREVGVEVPLVTANNCWYLHEGLIDAWSGAGDIVRTADELRQVQPEAPPMLLHAVGDARLVAESVAARADFACEVAAVRHRGATSATGCAERSATDLFLLRRALVFASTFGETIAGMIPDAPRVDADGGAVVSLRGTDDERVDVRFGARPTRSRKAADTPSDIGFAGHNLSIAGARLEHCSGSLVALLGDIVVVAGAARGKITVKVDGSQVSIAVPADGGAPRVTKVRGLRIAVVPHALAAGVGVADGAIEFVDAAGAVQARINRDGTVVRSKPAGRPGAANRTIATGAVRCVVETGLLDGTHPRFAKVHAPQSLGGMGIDSMHGYYAARVAAPKGKAGAKAKSKARDHWIDGAGVARTNRIALNPRGTMQVIEVRGDQLAPAGGHTHAQTGVTGPLREVAPLKGVKGAIVDLPRFDASRLGRFVWGYDARADAGTRRTVRWTFAARSTPVVVELPTWWMSAAQAQGGTLLRLNGEPILHTGAPGRTSVLLDGAMLSPLRPRKLAKGEKPPKAKAIQLEPGANELLLDLDPGLPTDERTLARLIKDTRFLEVLGIAQAEWSFARVLPPATWSNSIPAPRKPLAAPAWFRVPFSIVAPATLTLSCEHAVGSVATVLVNGQPSMVLDGRSGARCGTARSPRLRRTAVVPAAVLCAGENEICVFEPDGAMPAIELHGG